MQCIYVRLEVQQWVGTILERLKKVHFDFEETLAASLMSASMLILCTSVVDI